MILSNTCFSYWCHLCFLGIAFICNRNLICLKLEGLHHFSRIFEHAAMLAVSGMKTLYKVWTFQQVSFSDYLLRRCTGLSAYVQTNCGADLC